MNLFVNNMRVGKTKLMKELHEEAAIQVTHVARRLSGLRHHEAAAGARNLQIWKDRGFAVVG